MHDGIVPAQNGEAWLARTEAQRSRNFIDVGANVGDWAALFLQSMPQVEKVILCEPADAAVKKLRQRFGQVSEVEIVQAAISDTTGEVSFFEQPDAGQMSSLLQAYSGDRAVEKRTPMSTLDERPNDAFLAMLTLSRSMLRVTTCASYAALPAYSHSS